MDKKRNLLILLLMFVALTTKAQLQVEEFDYPLGNLVESSKGVWSNASVSEAKDLQVVKGSLIYPGYFSARGNQIAIALNGAEAVRSTFKPVYGNGKTLYTSFLINASSSATASAYFAYYLQTGLSSHRARVFSRGSAGNTKFQLGLAGDNNVATYSQNLEFGKTYLVVLAYTFVSGTANDTVKLWINPELSAEEPAALIAVALASDFNKIDGFSIKQAAREAGVNATLDGIKTFLNWSELANGTK